MAAKTRTIYGQAYIVGTALVQDLIFLSTLDGKYIDRSESTVIVINNIWDDLKDKNGTSKMGRPGYWYWEVNMSEIDDPDITIKVKVECPKPGPEIFDNDLEDKSTDSDWTLYWKDKMRKILDSPYNSKNAMSPEEIILPGTKYVDQNGDLVVLDDVKIAKNGLSDAQNLMMSLF